MSQWSDFVKDYCSKTGVTYTVASKDPAVKILYKEWKASIVDLEIVEEEAKEEAKLEEVKEEFKEADVNAVAFGPIVLLPPPATPIVFCSKKKKALGVVRSF